MHNKKIKKNLKLTLIILISIIFCFLIFFRSFHYYLYDYDFYDQEYQKNQVYDSMDENKVYLATQELWDYLRGSGDLSDKYYNEKERLHMVDVKNLIDTGYSIYYSFVIVIFVLLIILYRLDNQNKFKYIRNIRNILFLISFLVVGFSAFVFLLQKHFTYAFIKFHELFFTNDFWLLNPKTDLLINLYPNQFFYDFVATVFIKSLFSAAVLLIIALFLLFYQKRQASFHRSG